MDVHGAYPPNGDLFRDSNLAQIQEFLERGGDPNYRYYSGVALFHVAVNTVFDNVRVVRELINAGADVNLRTHLDLTPLHFAVYHRKEQVVRALIQAGASVNTKDFLGITVLHLAVSNPVSFGDRMVYEMLQDSRIISELLKHKNVDVNAVDSNGETALMMAVKNERNSAAIQLLRNNANPNICNNVSETPLHAAFALPPNYIQLQLLLRGANIYSVDRNGQTPLDILLKNILSNRKRKFIFLILKVIAFRYNMSSDLKRKFEIVDQLSQFFNKCCDEVDHMRRDFISGNVTMYDFICDCFDENDFKYPLLQIHKPVVERLIKDIYPEYFFEIFENIPEFSLFSILQMKASSKKHAKAKGNAKDLADLLSILDVIYLFSKYLSHVDFFCLIVAFSDVIIAESMQNLHERDFNYCLFYLN
ncbi:Putative ankyrin repeat protein FPV162 [Araneus ventricosus]|uniref:Ankyrin repeat protein FPV162 n=1 Tax=Araneus ventricosus TaxID=182803 RepID=A0A4Y2JNH6_ARAVE|nr:Putative ankyrin repeat protein FPV162 [Araneus ventricosus]